MNKKEFYSFFKSVPKAEIHIHLEAVMSRDTIKALYLKKNGVEFTEEEMEQWFSYDNLNGFIQTFLKVQELFTSVDDFDLVFDDLKKYLVRNGVVHCEAFFAPSAFIKKGFDYKLMTENFSRNCAKIKKDTGITVKLLGDVSRTFGLENAENNYKMFRENPFDSFIGIGLGGAEAKGPSREFGPVFEKAAADGYHAVAHAGEDVGPESIWDALKICHAERIGHGITACQDNELMTYLADNKIPLEICPTSNTFTKAVVKKLEEHPLRTFFDKGILVTVNTDDPIFFGVELLDEYYNIHKKLNFTETELKQIILNGFDASFLSASEKKKFKADVEKAFSE